MSKKMVIIVIIIVTSLLIIGLGVSFMLNNKYISEVTNIHYADIEMTQNGNNDNLDTYKNKFVNEIKKHLSNEDKNIFETNFNSNYRGNISNEWNKINLNNIDTYTVFDAISYNKFKGIFSRASEVVGHNRYLFVIVTASSNNEIKYSYIYPYVYTNGNYVLDYSALYKISMIKHDFTLSHSGSELDGIKSKIFKFR